jgi:hypothetical protein
VAIAQGSAATTSSHGGDLAQDGRRDLLGRFGSDIQASGRVEASEFPIREVRRLPLEFDEESLGAGCWTEDAHVERARPKGDAQASAVEVESM